MDTTTISALVAIAYSDGFFDVSELEYINEKAKNLGLKNSELLEIIKNPYKNEFIHPITEEEKFQFIFDLMELIHVDGIIDEAENKIFHSYLKKLNFSAEYHDEIYVMVETAVVNKQNFNDFYKNILNDE